MSERSAAYTRDLRRIAIERIDVKWARNIVVSVAVGFTVPLLRGLGVDTLAIIQTALVTALFIALWECGNYLYVRFWVAPYEIFKDQAIAIKRLEAYLEIERETAASKHKNKG